MHLFLLLGFMCISGSEPEVICTISNPAVLGGTVTLTCELTLPDLAIEQLTWQKDTDNIPKNIAAQSKKYGVKIQPSFSQRVAVKGTEPSRSSLTIYDLKPEDEAHYICIFNVFPHGSFKGKIYLPVSDSVSAEAANEQRPQKEEKDTAGMVEFRGHLQIIIVLLAIVTLLCVVLLYECRWKKKHSASKSTPGSALM